MPANQSNASKAREREYAREYRRRNRERANAATRAYRERNKSAAARRARLYAKKNKQKVQAIYKRSKQKYSARSRERRRAQKLEAINRYGGRCVCCGQECIAFLTIDHVHNDGRDHRRGTGQYQGTGVGIYRWLWKHDYPQDGRFQVLCYDCNCAKQFDPIGHREAHPNARFIDGLGEDGRRPTTGNDTHVAPTSQVDAQGLLWLDDASSD